MARGAEYSLYIMIDMLKALLAYEQAGRTPSTYEIAQFMKKDQSVVIRYRNLLEKLGLIVVRPEGPRNLIILTSKGRCLAKCLVS
ncbi:MAG: hypothetical protein F7C07_05520 [Desulfurococcales archaeon]|nr:hypothetical protein [Desulfurococcales archaeon]